MALPRINDDKPIYEVTLPTNKKNYRYRPFLVKEQRNILMASESESAREGVIAMLKCVESCAPDVKIEDMSTAEVDYIFLQIRGKSVGEKSNLNVKCSECSTENQVSVDLTEVDISGYQENDVFELTDKIKLKLKYPTYADTIKNIEDIQNEETASGLIFKTLKIALHSLEVDEELIMFSDETEEEIDGFLNSLSGDQLEKCLTFIRDLPKINYDLKFDCKKCNHKNEIKLEGFQDFF